MSNHASNQNYFSSALLHQ